MAALAADATGGGRGGGSGGRGGALPSALTNFLLSDADAVAQARQGVQTAAGTVTVGARSRRRPYITTVLGQDPRGARLIELLEVGSADDIDGAILQRSLSAAASGMSVDAARVVRRLRIRASTPGVDGCCGGAELLPGELAADWEGLSSAPALVLRLTVSSQAAPSRQRSDIVSEMDLPLTCATSSASSDSFFRELRLAALSPGELLSLMRLFYTSMPLAPGTLTNLVKYACAHPGSRVLVLDALLAMIFDVSVDAGADRSARHPTLPLTVLRGGSGGSGDPDIPTLHVEPFPPGALFRPGYARSNGLESRRNGLCVRPDAAVGASSWPPPYTLGRIYNVLSAMVALDPRVSLYLLSGDGSAPLPDAAPEAATAATRGDSSLPPAEASYAPAGSKRRRDEPDDSPLRGPGPSRKAPTAASPADSDAAAAAAAAPPLHQLLSVLNRRVFREDRVVLASHVQVRAPSVVVVVAVGACPACAELPPPL